jgi:hypothetical protein
MARPLNVVLLVVDSLRARSLGGDEGPTTPRTPFLARLGDLATRFTRAHATECWTLPSHASMFTGLLPSAHGAHFGTMAYRGSAPTIAELLAEAGYDTALVTRNSIFDGTLPGIARGFREAVHPTSPLGSGVNLLSLMLALSKPRFRRQIRTSGFFHPLQRASRRFVTEFARATLPADEHALAHVLARMEAGRKRGVPYFVFCNLYDVHAPYPPSERSIFPPLGARGAVVDRLVMPFVLPCLGGHAYLRPGFRLSDTSRRLLLARYHRAIELMDAKLERFYSDARGRGLLDDTLLIVTSDHGEAFGEHGLYLHDASVYQTHLHVPLWVHHPAVAPARVEDEVSTAGLFGLMRAARDGDAVAGTLLDARRRAAEPFVVAEHFAYPHLKECLPAYRQNLVAVRIGGAKFVCRGADVVRYDLARDADELAPEPATLADVEAACRAAGAAGAVTSGLIDELRARSEARLRLGSSSAGGGTAAFDRAGGLPAAAERQT